MVDKEDFVTYEQAVKLKALGFDWNCHTWYHWDNWCGLTYSGMCENHNMFEKCISGPSLYQVQKWLREKNIEVMSYYDYTTKTWIYEVCEIGEPHSCGYHSDDFGLNKSTYEEAISAGIDTALEIYFKNYE